MRIKNKGIGWDDGVNIAAHCGRHLGI